MIAEPKPRPSTGNWKKGTFEGGELRKMNVYKLKFKVKAKGIQIKAITVIRKQLGGHLMIRQDENKDWLVKCEESIITYVEQLGVLVGIKAELHENQDQ